MNLAVLGAIAASNRAHGYSFWNKGNPHSNVFRYSTSATGSHDVSTLVTTDTTKNAYIQSSELVIKNTFTNAASGFILACNDKTFTASELSTYKTMLVQLRSAATTGTYNLMFETTNAATYLNINWDSLRTTRKTISSIKASSFTNGLYIAQFDISDISWPSTTNPYRMIFRIDKTANGSIEWAIQKWQLLK